MKCEICSEILDGVEVYYNGLTCNACKSKNTEHDKPDRSDNQCDGCAQGLKGIHRTVDDRAFMVCSKDKYNMHIVESLGWLIHYANGEKEVFIGPFTDKIILLEGDEADPIKFTHEPLYTLDQAMPLCVELIMACERLAILNRSYYDPVSLNRFVTTAAEVLEILKNE